MFPTMYPGCSVATFAAFANIASVSRRICAASAWLGLDLDDGANEIQSIVIEEDRFGFEPEVTAKILRRGIRIYEVPISYTGREFDEGKKITWRDGFPALYALVKYRFRD